MIDNILSVKLRDRLIDIAHSTLDDLANNESDPLQLDSQLKMSSFALSYLKRHSLGELLLLLNRSHASDASDKHWPIFTSRLKPRLLQLEKEVTNEKLQKPAALYLLGWLHRISHKPAEKHPAGNSNYLAESNRRDEVVPVVQPSTFKIGDVQGKVLTTDDSSPNKGPKVTPVVFMEGKKEKAIVVEGGNEGKVRLLADGSVVTKVQIFGKEIGAEISIKVLKVDKNGRVTAARLA